MAEYIRSVCGGCDCDGRGMEGDYCSGWWYGDGLVVTGCSGVGDGW